MHAGHNYGTGTSYQFANCVGPARRSSAGGGVRTHALMEEERETLGETV
jgi:hypothetical protein